MTSTTNVRWWLAAVEAIASIASVMRCSAVSAPIVMSVPAMSLSIEPTRPTMLKGRACAAGGAVHGAGGGELRHELRPLLPQDVGAGEAAVAADHHEAVDAGLQEVLRRQAAGPRASGTGPSARCR